MFMSYLNFLRIMTKNERIHFFKSGLKKSILIFFLLNCLSAQAKISQDIRKNIIEAVVQIFPYDNDYGLPELQSGSGTIISSDGYILTNFHVIGDNQTGKYYHHHKIYTVSADRTHLPPQFSYWAKFIAGDPENDLALIKIYEDIDGDLPESNFPAVEVGNANKLLPGDELTIVGYPSISGTTITFTAGLMSGWLGEDLTSGGKQWIKTDGKISYGNSGGAVLNDQGELIGIPTLYKIDDAQEQAYLRPTNLAWPIIGANVTSSKPEVTQAANDANLTSAKITTPTRLAEARVYGSKNYGEIVVGDIINSVIGAEHNKITFHTYTIKIPEGLNLLTIAVNGHGHDIDMSVQLGSEVNNYDQIDYIDTAVDNHPYYTYKNPPAGTIHVDVMNLLNEPIPYTLSVTEAPFHNAQDMQNAQPSGSYGYVGLGKQVKGIINPEKTIVYHTYFADIPQGLKSFIIVLSSQYDLDIALKFGEEITNYADKASGGDWDYRDISTNTETAINISQPQAGRWYIDVINTFNSNEDLFYTLQVLEP